MSEVKHTPTPWVVSEDHPHVVIAGDYKYHPHWLGIGSMSEMDANARLIAAAPELLIALKTIVHNYDTGNYTAIDMPAAREAIAKAEGRS